MNPKEKAIDILGVEEEEVGRGEAR